MAFSARLTEPCEAEISLRIRASSGEALSRIRIEGLFMDEAELFSLRKMLDYAGQLERFFATLDKAKYPLLSQESGIGSQFGNIITTIDCILDRYGKMRDNASP